MLRVPTPIASTSGYRGVGAGPSSGSIDGIAVKLGCTVTVGETPTEAEGLVGEAPDTQAPTSAATKSVAKGRSERVVKRLAPGWAKVTGAPVGQVATTWPSVHWTGQP